MLFRRMGCQADQADQADQAGVVRDGSVRETFGFRWVMMAPRDAGSGARVCLFYSAAEVALG